MELEKKRKANKYDRGPILDRRPGNRILTGKEVDAPLLYGRQEAAEALGISETTLDRMHRERIGPKRISIGRRILYPRESLESWVQEQPEG